METAWEERFSSRSPEVRQARAGADVEIDEYDLDAAMLEAVRRDGTTRARVYRSAFVAVVLGRGSKLELEVNADAVLRDGILVLRRRGGGCAVVLDPGNVIVSLVRGHEGLGGGKRAFEPISDWLIGGLARLGFAGIVQRGISDLTFQGRKLGGACIHQPLRLLYYSTTLLVRPDVSLSERYLKHPPREPGYRASRRHRDFMGSFADIWGVGDVDAFADQLAEALPHADPVDGKPCRLEPPARASSSVPVCRSDRRSS